MNGATAQPDKVRIFDGTNHYFLSHAEWKKSLLKDLCQVVVFSGPRGSGKTLSTTYLAAKALMSGHKVWSNYPIDFWGIIPGSDPVHYQSIDLDMMDIYMMERGLAEGIVVIDEANLWVPGRRSMSKRNELINAMVQQIRKRKLTFLAATQNFHSLDSMFRFQTDLHILCSDQSFMGHCEPGEFITWRVRDQSGMYTGKTFDPSDPVENVLWFWGKPMWNCYNSWWEFDTVDAGRSIDVVRDRKVIDQRTNRQVEGGGDFDETLKEVMKKVIGDSFPVSSIQEHFRDSGLNLDNKEIGRVMRANGYQYKQTSPGKDNLYIRVDSEDDSVGS